MKPSFFLLPAALLAASAAFAGNIVIKGSDTLGAKFVPQLAEAFKAKNPKITFEIAAEGSTTGIAAIIDGTAQIGMSSRPAKPTEVSAADAKGVKLTPTVVAFDGIAVIVNAKNAVKQLTKKQVEQIFTGDVTDWSAVGGKAGKISIYTRNTSSGTFSEFKEMAMKKRDYAGTAQKMAGNEQIAQEVANNPEGVGYVGLAYVKTAGIAVLKLDGIELNDETVRDNKWPYSRETYFYTKGAPAGEVKEFVDFTVGSEGQQIAKQVGFVQIK